jgi:hypothetical protein
MHRLACCGRTRALPHALLPRAPGAALPPHVRSLPTSHASAPGHGYSLAVRKAQYNHSRTLACSAACAEVGSGSAAAAVDPETSFGAAVAYSASMPAVAGSDVFKHAMPKDEIGATRFLEVRDPRRRRHTSLPILPYCVPALTCAPASRRTPNSMAAESASPFSTPASTPAQRGYRSPATASPRQGLGQGNAVPCPSPLPRHDPPQPAPSAPDKVVQADIWSAWKGR